MVAAVGRHAHERLGHEAREGSQLAAHLLAYLPVGGEPVGGELGPVEVEVQLELAGGVLVVALDHVEAHGLAVLDHLVDEGLELGELVDVVAVGLGHALDGWLAVGVDFEPHHLGLAAGPQVQPVLGLEFSVKPPEVAAAVRGEEGAAVHFLLAAPEQRAPHPGRSPVPGQGHERLRLADADQLAGLGAVADVVAVAVGEEVGGGAVHELEALAGDHAEVLGRDPLAHDPARHRDELAVQVPDVVGLDAGLHLCDLLLASIGLDEPLKISGHCSPYRAGCVCCETVALGV